ncbi:MAG: toprim domain-containing protein [Nanoarchaeota archaeon]
MSKYNIQLTGFITNMHDPDLNTLQSILRRLNKKIKPETLLQHGVKHGIIGNLPVLAFPMHSEDWHCVNYMKYPQEPRFLNGTTTDKRARLGFLGYTQWNKNAEEVMITEGPWDMMILRESDYNVLGLPGVSSLREEWLKDNKETFKKQVVYLCLDNDKAGVEWTWRHAATLHPYAKAVKIIILPKKAIITKVDGKTVDVKWLQE